MTKILVCVEDKSTQDIVVTGVRQFADVTAWVVPPARVAELVSADDYDAVIVDLHRNFEETGQLVRAIRAADRTIEILCLVERNVRERHNRLKLEAGVFSFIPIPLDPFDLAKRVQRLRCHLADSVPRPS